MLADVGMADTWLLRLRGLLFRAPLGRSRLQGLILTPCASIHTLGMRCVLDVVFLDAGGRVLSIHEQVRPWRACLHRGARSVLELPAGAVQGFSITTGEELTWQAA